MVTLKLSLKALSLERLAILISLIDRFDKAAIAFQDPENPRRFIFQGLPPTEETILKEYRNRQRSAAMTKFRSLVMECEKPILFQGSLYEEPCGSPSLVGCLCQSETKEAKGDS